MDASKWLAIVGVISALTLGAGFITGLISVGLGWKINRQQNVEVARANESAADAKLKADKLEGDNLTLRGQVATLETAAADAKKDVAGLQKAAADAQNQLSEQQGRTATLEKAAADALAAQQRVETELARQRERTAKAERALLELQERLKHRHLTDEQASRFVEELRKLPNQTIELAFVGGGSADDAFNFAKELLGLFKRAGWTVRNADRLEHLMDVQFAGIGLFMHGPPAEPGTRVAVELTPLLATLQTAFKTLNVDAQIINWQQGSGETVKVVVGIKPEP